MGKTRNQAVVMIHGIGEQTPMSTLRNFVRTVWTEDEALHREGASVEPWSSPDRVSGAFDLRRLITARSKNGIKTDFFEFYWAHLVQDTKLPHVLRWLFSLLKRRPEKVSHSVAFAWLIAVVIFIAGVLVALAVLTGLDGGRVQALLNIENQFYAVLAPLAAAAFANAILLPVVGDAARYLTPAPYNIESRHKIRAAGVERLRRLIDSGDYDRIIVVGHSLGSIIGYDILRGAWPFYNIQRPDQSPAETQGLEALEDAARAEPFDAEAYRDGQRAYLEELRANGNPWCVTDFITLGSPLSAGAWLLAENEAAFRARIRDREFPACPPYNAGNQEEGRFSYEVPKNTHTNLPAFRVPDHGAVFAPVRWTNIYFPSALALWGDIVGGRLQPLFGKGVKDVSVLTNHRFGFMTHNFYWTPEKAPFSPNRHIAALREAVNMLDE